MADWRFFILLPGAMVFIFPVISWASCSAASGWNNKFITFTLPSQITVQADAAVGMPFYEIQTPATGNGETFAYCNGTWTTGTKYYNSWATDSNGIAATNVAGVGVRIYWMDGGTNQYLVPTDPMGTYSGTYEAYWGPGEPSWKIQLIKTGDITGGTLQGGGWASYGAGGVLVTTLNIGGGGTIVSTGCSITTPNINVPLGQREKKAFNGTGSTTSWQDFNIDLTCSKNARINVRIDATPDASAGAQGVMQLDKTAGDMAATGIGIQIGYRSDASPLQFGQEKYYWTSASGGYENIQLRARYYQTAKNITAGEANGTATFTLTYK